MPGPDPVVITVWPARTAGRERNVSSGHREDAVADDHVALNGTDAYPRCRAGRGRRVVPVGLQVAVAVGVHPDVKLRSLKAGVFSHWHL
jgi:hypothetical protein